MFLPLFSVHHQFFYLQKCVSRATYVAGVLLKKRTYHIVFNVIKTWIKKELPTQ